MHDTSPLQDRDLSTARPLQQLLSQVSSGLARHLAPLVHSELASFATRVVSLDETTWDAMQRHLVSQRTLPDGDARLLLFLAEIARLYARRWDIELAFLTLTEPLGLHQWWSSHPLLIQQQILVVLILAQLVQQGQGDRGLGAHPWCGPWLHSSCQQAAPRASRDRFEPTHLPSS